MDTRTPPLRRMLMCSKAPDFTWINIFLFNHRQPASLVLITPEVMCAEQLKKPPIAEDGSKNYDLLWLESLLECLEMGDTSSAIDVVYVRTNVRRLHTIIDQDLYVRDVNAAKVSQAIHRRLAIMGTEVETRSTKSIVPVELQCSLLH